MRFMIMVRACKESESGVLPSQEILAEMGKFNEMLAQAGVLLSLEGLRPTSKGARVRFSEGRTTVTDGPFAETKEIVGGFWIWQVKSKQEAIDWLKRSPFKETEVEIRELYEPEDFAAKFTSALARQDEQPRAQAEELKHAANR